MEKTKKIEKPWCVRIGTIGRLWGWGKIEKEYWGKDYTTYDIRYSENEDLRPWDSRYIERFNTLEEMIEYYIKNRSPCDTRLGRGLTDSELRERVKRDFSSYFKKKDRK